MARRYRRTGRYSRRLKTVKYSNETMSATAEMTTGNALVMVAATTVQGMRKCKNFELKINMESVEAAPEANTICYALVYVPENTDPNDLVYGTTNAANLYQPSQNIIMSGFAKPGLNYVNINRTRLARNLNSGDSIQLLIKPTRAVTSGKYLVNATLNFAITY